MWGCNWIDAVIVVLLALAVLKGLRTGFLTQMFVIVGFFGALFIAGWLFPHLLPFHDSTFKAICNAALVLAAAAAAGAFSYSYGQKVHWSFRIGKRTHEHKLKSLETILGGLPALAAGLAFVWLLGVAIGRLPFTGFSNSVSDSRIVQQLARSLPAVPAVFAQFDRQVNPNTGPYIAAQPKPQAGFNYAPTDVDRAESKAASVVRITSFGCGGVVSGTGFAVGQDLVATDAHVIAGVKRPIIKYQGSSYEGVPVYFDAGLDLAILRVSGLQIPPLVLVNTGTPLNTTVAVLGYPGGNYRAVPGIIRDTLAVSAASIYDQGSFGRGIYEVQTQVNFGSSGSPVVLGSGQVAGIIFSKAGSAANYAFALTSSHIATALQQAKTSHERVSTRACMVQ